jgi:hypothetical protein
MLNTGNNTHHDMFHTLSVDEIDLVAGGFDWKSGLAGAAAGAGAGALFVLVLLAI